MEYEIIRSAQNQANRWASGETTQLFIYPATADFIRRDFQLRISTATVEQEESNFTIFTGITRRLMVLEGAIRLEHIGRHTVHLEPLEPYTFEGDWETKGFGKVRDFNLMTTGKASGGLSAMTLAPGAACKLETTADIDLIYVQQGSVAFGTEILEAKDSLLLQGAGKLKEIQLKANAETILICARGML
jgi:environmental stress-induced protein Ves